jgi:surface polysaccharide O-acyltransferase-like enzyme
MQAPQHLKQISTPLFEAISGLLFNHLNVANLDE